MAASSAPASSGNSASGNPGAALPASRQAAQPAKAKGGGESGARISGPPPSTKGQRATGDSILEAVDGEGNAPSLAKADQAPAEKQAPKAKKPNAATDRAAAADEISAPSDHVDLEAIFQEALKPQNAKPTEDDLLVGEDGQPLSPREQNRIQFLANRARTAENRAVQVENQMRSMSERFEQMQNGLGQHLLEVSQQNARLQGQLQMLMNGQRREALDPAEQIEQDLIGKARDASRKAMDPEIRALRQELEGFKRQAAEQQRAAQIENTKSRYSGEAQHAARSVVLAGFPEEAQSRLMPLAQELVMAKAWGRRTNMASAAKMVRDDFLSLGLEFVRAQSRQNLKQRQQTEGAPTAPPTQRSVGEGEAEPSFDDLRANGYNGMNPFLDWDLAGRPTLRR